MLPELVVTIKKNDRDYKNYCKKRDNMTYLSKCEITTINNNTNIDVNTNNKQIEKSIISNDKFELDSYSFNDNG